MTSTALDKEADQETSLKRELKSGQIWERKKCHRVVNLQKRNPGRWDRKGEYL